MYPAMGLEYAVSCFWVMHAFNSGVVFSAQSMCTNRTQWNTCSMSSPQITVFENSFPVQGRLKDALATRAGAFVHLPVLSRVASHEPRGPPPECTISSWSSPAKNQGPATFRRRRSHCILLSSSYRAHRVSKTPHSYEECIRRLESNLLVPRHLAAQNPELKNGSLEDKEGRIPGDPCPQATGSWQFDAVHGLHPDEAVTSFVHSFCPASSFV